MTEVTDANHQGKQLTAQQHNISAAKGISRLVESTLGPNGLDTLLVDNSGRITVTNDGATIMRETNITDHTARMVVQVAKTQEAECYDGTTTAIVLAAELLKQAETLLGMGIHPTMIVKGYKKASKKALEYLNALVLADDGSADILTMVAQTAMTGKAAEEDKEHLAKVCVDAVKSSDSPEKINVVVRPGAPVSETFMVDGVIVDKAKVNYAMPDEIMDARVALIESEVTLPAISKGVNVQFTSGEEADAYMAKKKEQLIEVANHLISLGANVVLCMKDIDPIVHEHLARCGVFACRRVASSDLEMVAEATDGMIVSNITDLEPTDLGTCTSVIQKEYASSERPLVMFEGCFNDTVSSVMVFAPIEHLVFEIGRALDDALGVVYLASNEEVVTGGGSTFMEMSLKVKDYATTVGGRAQLAAEAFSKAMEVIPATLAANAGLTPIDSLIALRAAHAGGEVHAYVNLESGEVISDAYSIIEPKKVVSMALTSATDLACMILRIDKNVMAKDADDPFEMM